jgi:hypothetical protein
MVEIGGAGDTYLQEEGIQFLSHAGCLVVVEAPKCMRF